MRKRRLHSAALGLLALLAVSGTLQAQIIRIPFEATNVEPLEGGKSYYGYNGTKATLNDVSIESDTMLMLGEQGKIIAKGNVKMTKADLGAVADEMVIDFFSGYFEMKEAQGYFMVTTAPNNLFYFSGADLRGYPDRFVVRQAYLTSCPFDCSQEWHLRGSKALVRSGKSMEMWNAVGYIGPVPIFYLPYMYMDLHQRQSKWYINPGKNKVEGKFVKTMYTFAATATYAGALMLDHSEKRGNRYGIDQEYRLKWFGGEKGKFRYNWQEDKQAKRSRQDIKLDQAFPLFGAKGSVAFTQASNYSLNVGTPDTNNSSGNFQLNGKKTTLKAGFTRTGGATSARNTNADLSNQMKLFGLGLQSSFRWVDSRSGKTSSPQTLDVNESLTGSPSHLLSNWSLKYQKRYMLTHKGSQQSFGFTTTQSPLFNASFNPKLWRKNFVGRWLLLNMASITMAVQGQGSTTSQKKIFFGDTEFQQRKSFKFGKQVNLDLSNRVKQAIFGSGDARYQVFPSANLGWTHTKSIRSTFNFMYSQQHGRDPFLTGKYSKGLNGSYQFAAAPGSNKWNVNLGTNYNFLQHKFTSPLTATLAIPRLSRRWGWSLNATTAFDLHKSQFQPLNIQQKIATRFMDFSFTYNYDLQKQRVKTTQGQMKLLLVGGWQILLQETHTSGSRGQGPLLQSIVINKMNCCTGYQLVYNAKSREIRFNWFISAFPTQTLGLSAGNTGLLFNPPAGLRQLGQGIGGTGAGGYSGGSYGGY